MLSFYKKDVNQNAFLSQKEKSKTINLAWYYLNNLLTFNYFNVLQNLFFGLKLCFNNSTIESEIDISVNDIDKQKEEGW